jgi:hypothetical protein
VNGILNGTGPGVPLRQCQMARGTDKSYIWMMHSSFLVNVFGRSPFSHQQIKTLFFLNLKPETEKRFSFQVSLAKNVE